MDTDDYIEAIRQNVPPLLNAVRSAATRPVPSCPRWTVAGLVVHLGGVHRFWTAQVQAGGEQVPMDETRYVAMFASVPGLPEWEEASWKGQSDPAALPPGTLEWFEDGARELADTLAALDPEAPAWHWSGDNTVRSTMRMQAIETTLHRWDAENAVGTPGPIAPDLALDGIDHTFDVMLPARRRWKEPRPGTGETYHFHRTDGPGEWLLRFDPDGVSVSRKHARGDVAVRAPAASLFLFLWGRESPDRLEVFGDRDLLDRYVELVPPA